MCGSRFKIEGRDAMTAQASKPGGSEDCHSPREQSTQESDRKTPVVIGEKRAREYDQPTIDDGERGLVIRPKDSFDQLCEEMKAIDGLPFDLENDEYAGPKSFLQEDSTPQSCRASGTARSGPKMSTKETEQTFACMRKHDGNDIFSNPKCTNH
jgi:hypothetical protein